MMRTRFDDGGWTDVHDTLGTMLMLAERSRNDPAFQYGTRDQAVIDRELSRVPVPTPGSQARSRSMGSLVPSRE
jgi:hypothetical protein